MTRSKGPAGPLVPAPSAPSPRGVGTVPGPDPVLTLPSCGPDPLPLDLALAAVVGYARGRRPLWFRSPGDPAGRWVQVPAFGWSRFDAVAPQRAGPLDDHDILLGEVLHGRLDRAAWTDVHEALAHVGPLADAAVEHAAGRAFWALAPEELSVLGEPGTVGARLREIVANAGSHPAHVAAALHHRHPDLVPHLTRTTRRALLPHLEEGDSGVEAVVWRELRANEVAFAALEDAVAGTLDDARPARLRLHDVLLWLSTTLRFAHALALARGRPVT